jgi:hypothetical protein
MCEAVQVHRDYTDVQMEPAAVSIRLNVVGYSPPGWRDFLTRYISEMSVK